MDVFNKHCHGTVSYKIYAFYSVCMLFLCGINNMI